METKKTDSGIVYVLTNPAMPGMVKIGMCTNIDERLKTLFTTNVPLPFDPVCACKVDDRRKVEKALQEAFEPDRVHPKREFYSIDPKRAIGLLKLLGTDITKEFADEISKDLSEDDKTAEENFERFEKLRQKRPPLNFNEMKIPVGAKLVYTKDNTIEVEVCGDKKVLYKGEETSLSPITKDLLGVDRGVQPTGYWTYNGKNLLDIYNETYPPNVE
jgi:hypothetical protein